jgi:hypothetical protein
MMDEAKSQFGKEFFMQVFMIASWRIWMRRNDFIYNRGRSTFNSGG